MSMLERVEHFSDQLRALGHDNPKRTVEELIAHYLGCNPLEIYTQSMPNESALAQEMQRLCAGEPLAYVVGRAYFYDVALKSDPRALIPRPETELLVETVLESAIPALDAPRIIDVGTGSGCIALTLAQHISQAHVEAVDSSASALELAFENAQMLGLAERLVWHHNSLLNERENEAYDAVVSNPPYIDTATWKTLSNSVRDFEPRAALDAGPEGTECYEMLAPEAWRVLKPEGLLMLEIGFDQGKAVERILERNGFHHIEIKKDLHGHDRVVVGQK